MSPRRALVVRLLLAVTAAVALAVMGLGLVASLGCCAIDPERFPEQHARNRQRQGQAAWVTLTALVVAVGAVVGAVRVRPGRA